MNDWWEYDYHSPITSLMVRSSPSIRDTGLVDQYGDKIYSEKNRHPIGFVDFSKESKMPADRPYPKGENQDMSKTAMKAKAKKRGRKHKGSNPFQKMAKSVKGK